MRIRWAYVLSVILAEAGIHRIALIGSGDWIPASAGMTWVAGEARVKIIRVILPGCNRVTMAALLKIAESQADN